MHGSTGREFGNERKCTECGMGSADRVVVNVAAENRGGRSAESDDGAVDGGSL